MPEIRRQLTEKRPTRSDAERQAPCIVVHLLQRDTDVRALVTALFVLVSALTLDAQSRLFVNASHGTRAVTAAITLPTGTIEWLFESPPASRLLTTADGKFLVAVVNNSLILVDVETRAASTLVPASLIGRSVIAHPRRLELYAWTTDGRVASITQHAWRPLFSCTGGTDLAISADGRRLITTCGHNIVVIDADSGALINSFSTGRVVDHPATNIDGSRVVVRELMHLGWPHHDLSLYDVATGRRLVERISPALSALGPGVVAILDATPNRDALLVVDHWNWIGSCGHVYHPRLIDFDTLSIRQTLPVAGTDQAVTGGFTANSNFAVLGWMHAVSTCGPYDAGLSLFDIATNEIVSSVDITAITTESVQLSLANAPLPPDHLTAHVSGDHVTLSWTQPPASAAATRYVIEAGSAPASSDVMVYTVDGAVTSITADNVAAGRYYLRIRAVNFTGSSGPSQEIVVNVI